MEFLKNYYHLFDWHNGENTCIVFTVLTVVALAFIVFEIVCKKIKKESLFF